MAIISLLKGNLKSILPILFLIIYTIIGAFIFMVLEGPNEINELKLLINERENLIEVSKSKILQFYEIMKYFFSLIIIPFFKGFNEFIGICFKTIFFYTIHKFF